MDGAQPYHPPRCLPQDLKFFEINETHSMAPTIARMFQLLTTPRILITNSESWKKNVYYALEGSDTRTFVDVKVRAFLNGFCSGALAPVDKTQAFTISPPDGTLQPIHGQAFEQVVLDEKIDVLVYFYNRTSNDSEGASN